MKYFAVPTISVSINYFIHSIHYLLRTILFGYFRYVFVMIRLGLKFFMLIPRLK